NLYQTSFHQRPQLQGNRSERDIRHGAMNGPRRLLLVPNQPQNLAAARRSDGSEGVGFHCFILVKTKIKSILFNVSLRERMDPIAALRNEQFPTEMSSLGRRFRLD